MVTTTADPIKDAPMRPRAALRGGAIAGLAVGLTLGMVYFLAYTSHVAPIRLPDFVYGLADLTTFLLLVGSTLIIVESILAILLMVWLRFTRDLAIASIAFAVLFFPLMFLSVNLAELTRHQAFVGLADRSASLTTAIEEFEGDAGRPPHSLNELVPAYLTKVPWTHIGASPEYDYATPSREYRPTGTWYLGIDTSDAGLMDFDAFFYDPNHVYEDATDYDSFERFGDWVYLHD